MEFQQRDEKPKIQNGKSEKTSQELWHSIEWSEVNILKNTFYIYF